MPRRKTIKKKKKGYKKSKTVPKGFKKTIGATTAPKGFEWYNNGKSRFSGKRKSILVKKR